MSNIPQNSAGAGTRYMRDNAADKQWVTVSLALTASQGQCTLPSVVFDGRVWLFNQGSGGGPLTWVNFPIEVLRSYKLDGQNTSAQGSVPALASGVRGQVSVCATGSRLYVFWVNDSTIMVSYADATGGGGLGYTWEGPFQIYQQDVASQTTAAATAPTGYIASYAAGSRVVCLSWATTSPQPQGLTSWELGEGGEAVTPSGAKIWVCPNWSQSLIAFENQGTSPVTPQGYLSAAWTTQGPGASWLVVAAAVNVNNNNANSTAIFVIPTDEGTLLPLHWSIPNSPQITVANYVMAYTATAVVSTDPIGRPQIFAPAPSGGLSVYSIDMSGTLNPSGLKIAQTLYDSASSNLPASTKWTSFAYVVDPVAFPQRRPSPWPTGATELIGVAHATWQLIVTGTKTNALSLTVMPYGELFFAENAGFLTVAAPNKIPEPPVVAPFFQPGINEWNPPQAPGTNAPIVLEGIVDGGIPLPACNVAAVAKNSRGIFDLWMLYEELGRVSYMQNTDAGGSKDIEAGVSVLWSVSEDVEKGIGVVFKSEGSLGFAATSRQVWHHSATRTVFASTSLVAGPAVPAGVVTTYPAAPFDDGAIVPTIPCFGSAFGSRPAGIAQTAALFYDTGTDAHATNCMTPTAMRIVSGANLTALYAVFSCTPGDLNSYGPDAINATMQRLYEGLPPGANPYFKAYGNGSNYMADVVEKLAVKLANGKNYLELVVGAFGGAHSDSSSNAEDYLGGSLQLDNSVWAGVKVVGELEVFGLGEGFSTSLLAGVRSTLVVKGELSTGGGTKLELQTDFARRNRQGPVTSYTVRLYFLPANNLWAREIQYFSPQTDAMIDFASSRPWKIMFVVPQDSIVLATS